MVNNVGNVVNQGSGDSPNGAILASSGPNNGQLYQGRRISVGQGNNADNGPLVPNHFHNRNQSLDVVNSNKLKSKFTNRKRPGGNNYLSSLNPDDGYADHGSMEESSPGQQKYKAGGLQAQGDFN